MQVTIEQQHEWLSRLVGTWTVESECSMGPDQPPSTMKGTEVVRSLGGVWMVAETAYVAPDGTGTNIMTLGYDPLQQKFVGTFISSMMTFLWNYTGSLDESGMVLTLDTEGPDFHNGGMAKYQDIITIVSDDHRTLTSRSLQADGTWQQFVVCDYWRQK